MTAALALALGVGVAASGWVRVRRVPAAPPALTCVLVLAAIVVLTVDISAAAGFRLAVPVAATAAVAIVGWIRRSPATDGTRAATWASAATLPVTALVLALPVILLPVPLDTDAQGFGHLALAIRQGGTLDSLTPWHPEIRYLYAPGALVVFATLSALLPALSLAEVMLGAAHLTALLFVWLAWELGEELGRSAAGVPSPAWAPAMALAAGTSIGLWTALLDAHYTAVLGLVFALATVTALWRFLRTRAHAHAGQASLALAGVLVTHADTAVILTLGLGALLVLGRWAADYPLNAWRLAGIAAIGVLGLALVTPWVLRIWPLLTSDVRSPFPVSATHWRQLVLTQGVLWPLLAIVGAAYALPARPLWALTMVGWLIGVLELSTLGWLERLLPGVAAAMVSRFNFPFSLAWHGPIIPCMALGASLLVRAAARVGARPLSVWLRRGLVAVSMAAGLAALLAGPLLTESRRIVGFHGAFASASDVAAMRWLRAHADPAARILNYPGDPIGRRDWEGHWAPVIAERDAVYFRWQPFFVVDGTSGLDPRGAVRVEQRELLEFWRDPADPAHAERLRKAHITHVLVPEVVGDPDSWRRAWRWRAPALLPDARSRVSEAPYLRRAFHAGGTAVYELCPDGPAPGSTGSACP